MPSLPEGGSWPTASNPVVAEAQAEGSQRPVHAAWHGPCGLRSTHVLTCGVPQPSAAQRLATSPCCAVQQQRRRRPQLVRPGARSPHDPRGHHCRDSGVLRPRGCRAPASLVAMLAARGKPTEAHLLLEQNLHRVVQLPSAPCSALIVARTILVWNGKFPHLNNRQPVQSLSERAVP